METKQSSSYNKTEQFFEKAYRIVSTMMMMPNLLSSVELLDILDKTSNKSHTRQALAIGKYMGLTTLTSIGSLIAVPLGAVSMAAITAVGVIALPAAKLVDTIGNFSHSSKTDAKNTAETTSTPVAESKATSDATIAGSTKNIQALVGKPDPKCANDSSAAKIVVSDSIKTRQAANKNQTAYIAEPTTSYALKR